MREELSARPRPASEASPAQSHPPAQAQLPLASTSPARFSAPRTLLPGASRRQRTGWLPGTRGSPSASILSPFPFRSGALVLKLSLQFCVSSELILMWQGTPPAEGKGAVRQGVIGRRLDSLSRLKAACGPWDPNLGTVTEMFQRVECGQVGPQRLEGGWDAFAQQIDCPF